MRTIPKCQQNKSHNQLAKSGSVEIYLYIALMGFTQQLAAVRVSLSFWVNWRCIQRRQTDKRAVLIAIHCWWFVILLWMKIDSRALHQTQYEHQRASQLQNSVESLAMKRYADTHRELSNCTSNNSKSGSWWCFIVSLETSLP